MESDSAATDGDAATVAACTVMLQPSGWVFQADRDQSILHSAEAAGLELPSSCRNGTCRTCICHMPSGSVYYQIAWPGLSREEKQEGWVLPCVAYPASDLVLDTPLATRVNFDPL